jgi:uncharacterized membrane protein
MTDAPPSPRHFEANFQTNLIAGLLTVTPLIVVWLVFDFFFTTLSHWGHPLAVELTVFLDMNFPLLKPWVDNDAVRYVIGFVVALLALYTIGAIASRVIGQQLILMLENLIVRIPGVQTVYSATKKLVDVLRQKPGSQNHRVVLLDYPSDGLKAIGFVMRTFADAKTGDELAAVYVPTAPNPTSGYLQIVPSTRLIQTDIPADQAMTMILSGGAVTPEHISLKGRL